MKMVEEKMEQIKAAYERSTLPNQPDLKKAEQLLVSIRMGFYHLI
jgi:hypothetical protein